jgi:hypothetical protein
MTERGLKNVLFCSIKFSLGENERLSLRKSPAEEIHE